MFKPLIEHEVRIYCLLKILVFFPLYVEYVDEIFNPHPHISLMGQFPQDGDFSQNMAFFLEKKSRAFVRPNLIIFLDVSNVTAQVCPLHPKNPFI